MITGTVRCIHKWYNRHRPSVDATAQIQHPSFLYRTATCLFLLTLTSLSAVWADDPRQLDISEQEQSIRVKWNSFAATGSGIISRARLVGC